MKGSVRSKLVVCLVILAVMVAIPFIGSISYTHAANAKPSAHHPKSTPTPTSTSMSNPSSTPTPDPAKWTVQLGIPYATLPFGSYSLNIYTPDPAPQGDTPLVLFFHGCCNPNTNRNNALKLGRTPADPLEYMFRMLMNNGYQVATLDFPSEYPVVDENGAEAGKAAVRFFRANAGTYHIDPTRIIAWGASAGGYPVTIMGTADASAGLDVGPDLVFSSRVEAVLDWYGVANNFSYITSDDAPFLIQQGLEDTAFLKADSQNLYNDLTAAHVSAQLQWVANAGHKFVPIGGVTDPTDEEIAQTAISFLNDTVKTNPNPQPQ